MPEQPDSAAEIAALRAENAVLRACPDAQRRRVMYFADLVVALRRDNGRLRLALLDIRDCRAGAWAAGKHPAEAQIQLAAILQQMAARALAQLPPSSIDDGPIAPPRLPGDG